MAIFTITRELGILTWDEAFLSLRCTLLPDAVRAKYCELIIGTQYCRCRSFTVRLIQCVRYTLFVGVDSIGSFS